jgi:DNA-binding response OmpR family regulator
MSKTILVVEDDQTIRELYTEILESEGYLVISAENGREAMKLIGSTPGFFPSLILTDLMMPVMDGLQFVQELKRDESWESVPVMMVSAAQERPKSQVGFEFIKKPLDLDSMVDRVKHHCTRGGSVA